MESLSSSNSPVQSIGLESTIKVVCRFRPQNEVELAHNGQPIVDIQNSGNDHTVVVRGRDFQGHFTFDRVFNWDANQSDVFEYCAESTIMDVLDGYNGTVFAYGQTGSGKTFTMMGKNEDEDLKGLIPRIVERIFERISECREDVEFTVRVSYLEIYLERIRDLLNPVNDNLPIHEDKLRGVYVKGMSEKYVASKAEVFEIMKQGNDARVVSSTNMNEQSSRSHSIFILNIDQKNLTDLSTKNGKLYLVDLAGSEKVNKTGATGQTLEEAKKINKSLSALGLVINALTDSKSSYVPYRDSKLTRILQESIGGNSKTTLIINTSPSSYNESETVSTLRFGMRAKKIHNQAKINREKSPAEIKKALESARAEISKLRTIISVFEKANNERQSDSPVVPIPIVDAKSTALDEEEREGFINRINELEEELFQQEKELKSRTTIQAAIEEQLEFYISKNDRLKRENQSTTSKLAELETQLVQVSLERKDLMTFYDAQEDELKHLKNQISSLQLKSPKVEVLNNSESKESAQTKLESAQSELTVFRKKLESKDELIMQLEKLVHEWQDKVHQLTISHEKETSLLLHQIHEFEKMFKPQKISKPLIIPHASNEKKEQESESESDMSPLP